MASTVLITGASSGIGAAFALRFAQANYNLILVARSEERLHAIAEQCRQINKLISVFIIQQDLNDNNAAEQIYQQVKQQHLTVDILINNAGVGLWGHFAELPFAEQQNLIQLTVSAIVHLTHLFVQDMIVRKQGKIVNIASVYSFVPVPYQAIYAASKAFLLSFSMSLAHELKTSGIKVTCICPGTTLTAFRKRYAKDEKAGIFTMSAEEVVKQSFPHIERGTLVFIPGFVNRLFLFLTARVPTRWLTAVVDWMVYRVRGYKKPSDKPPVTP